MLEKWNSRTSAGDVLYRDQLLGEIKTNMVNVINDYRGLGVENEQSLIARTNTLFTGDVIPSRKDWETLNYVLKELSTVKEQGQMYNHFIRDVSDSLGISDLEKIKEFINYIQTLPPLLATINVQMEPPQFYSVTNLKDTTSDEWEHANTTWDLSSNYLRKPKATISFNPSKSEDVSSYSIHLTAGSYSQTIVRPGTNLSAHVLELDWLSWFSSSQLRNAKLIVDMDITDKRGNTTRVSQSAVYPSSTTIPQGVNNYQVEYKLDNKAWKRVGNPTVRSFRYKMPGEDGNYSWRVRALDKSGKYTDWTTTSPRWIFYIPPPPPPQPPGAPSPEVTTTVREATITWKAVPKADYYEIWHGGENWAKENHGRNGNIYFSTVRTGQTLRVTHGKMNQGRKYTWYVRAVNKDGSSTGSATAIQKNPPDKPSPSATTTVHEATISWKPVARAEYYEVFHVANGNFASEEKWSKDNHGKNGRVYFSTVRAGQTLRVTHHKMVEGQKYTWVVRAVNKDGSNIGTTTATQKKYVNKEKTYRSTGTNVWRGGYHRIWKNWTKTWYGAKWRYSNSKKHNDVYQGAWHDADWGGWKARSGGAYWAYGGQKWGNNASYIYFDYEKIRSDLKGKNIQSVTITLTRRNSIHGWATGKPLYLYNHNKTTAQGPGNIDMYRRNRTRVSRSNQEVTQHIQFKRGQTEVVVNQNTKELWQNIVNGHMKGLGIVYYYGTDFNSNPPVAPVNYMYFNGNIKVDVKYKDIQ